VIDTLRDLGFDILAVVGGGLLVVLALRFGGALFDALPMSRGRRELIARVRPLAAAALIVLYVLFVAVWMLRDGVGQYTFYSVVVVGATVVVMSRGALADLLEGVYLRAARTFAVGDRVQIGTVRGRIQRLGVRHVYIEGSDGELAILSYRNITGQPILRAADVDRTAFHIFRVPLPPERTIADAKRLVRETALLNHWSSVARPPQVAATSAAELEVTVFAIDADQAPEIERAVRRALGG